MQEIDLYTAIAQMRQLSAAGLTFSIVHATLNTDTRTSTGIRAVHNARLRPAPSGKKIKHAEYKLFYEDLDLPPAEKNRNCWQMLIMYFNGKKVKLN